MTQGRCYEMRAGMRLGSYRVLRHLGTGATSEVYAAEDPAGQRVAIKLLHEELLTHPSAVLRFFNEERMARLVDHPGIAKVFATGWLPVSGAAPVAGAMAAATGRPYLVLEYLEGHLAARLRHGPLVMPAALSIAAQLAAALAALHAAGVVHRDLKPANVMFTPGITDRVKLLDFGLAKMLLPSSVSLGPWPVSTGEEDVLGTAEYRAPEQWIQAREVDGRADVYSLGVVLFELLTGCRPFKAERENLLMDMHLFRPPPVPERAPPAVAALIVHMLTKERHERPAMEEVAVVLDRLAASPPASASPLSSSKPAQR
jgi:serine/threonine protein kinase